MIKIANAPCSWGVLEFESKTASPGYRQVLDEMAQAGYAGTELGDWGFMPTDPQALSVDSAVPAEVLSAALYTRFRSRQDHTFAEKILSAMRKQFGGHQEAPKG